MSDSGTPGGTLAESRSAHVVLLLLGCVIAAVWTVLTIGFTLHTIETIRQQDAAAGFPTTTGTVLSGNVQGLPTSGTGPGTSSATWEYLPHVRFEYIVGRQRFESDVWRFGTQPFADINQAMQVVARYPAGQPVTVYYDPMRPARAVLEPGINGRDLFMQLFSAPFLIIMVGLWYGMGSAARRILRPAPYAGLRVHRSPQRIRVRLERFSPVVWTLLASFALSFGTVIAVAVLYGGSPSAGVVQAAWLVMAVGTGLVCLVLVYRSNRGTRDLIFDRRSGQLTMPVMKGRERREPIAFESVRGMSVIEEPKEMVPSDASSTQQDRFAVLLELQAASSEIQTVTVCSLASRKRADALLQILQEECLGT